MARKPKTPEEIRTEVRALLDGALDDAELRAALETLAAAEVNLPGAVWLWGPALYARHRVFFRPLILARFGTFEVRGLRWKQIAWKGAVGEALDAWLEQVDRDDDVELFRRLYAWKHRKGWGVDGSRVLRDLLSRLRAAGTPSARAGAFDRFDHWFLMTEPAALELYALGGDAAVPFILRRLPGGFTTRRLWKKLHAAATARGDEALAGPLYRRQVPIKDWRAEVLSLAASIRDPEALRAELERRHPEGWSLDLGGALHALLKARGRDLVPYVLAHLDHVGRPWLGKGDYGRLLGLARDRGWWDLWTALIRVVGSNREFDAEVLRVVDGDLSDEEAARRLLMLCGVSREWNFLGFGLSRVPQLGEEAALALYRRFPELLRGPFLVHLQISAWSPGYPALLRRLIDAGDEEVVDALAARMLTWGGAMFIDDRKHLEEAAFLADHYLALKDSPAFARRAAAVLSRVPAFTIPRYGVLVRRNRLARLLFERSASEYLDDPRSVMDLVEGSEIHVQALAYRALALDDPRAAAMALDNLPLLLGTLLRPLHRRTRAHAFGALLNAARADAGAAARVLDKAREALDLPDRKYPKEELVGLIAGILRRRPELRGEAERPVVYGRGAA